MSALLTLLEDFHSAILTGDAAPAIASIKRNPRLAPDEQLAIYIDGYRIRLTQAIRSDYPALLALLGNQVFDSMALAYIENHPPMGFNLDRYPYGFAAFVRDHHGDGFAADLATLEGAIAEVFVMPESDPLDPSMLAALAPEAFGDLVLQSQQALRVCWRIDYPVT